jgi:thiol-disulfide isomerase/thioredoxin
MDSMKRLYILALTLATTGALVSGCEKKPDSSASNAGTVSNQLALSEIKAPDLKKRIKDSGKPAIVNLWATWCEPCRKEMPALVQFHRSKELQVNLFLISADPAAEAAKANQFLAGLGFKLEPSYLYRLGEDAETFGKGLAPTWSAILPTTFILDETGALRTFWVGENTQKQLEEHLSKALAARVPDPALQRHAK